MTCYADTFAAIKPGALGKAFTIALLLSAGVQRAEAALLAAVGQLDPDQISGDALIRACLKHATMPQPRSTDRIEPVENTPLPLELRRILLLPTYLRHSFVLRILLKLSPEECTRLNVRNANQGACAAARELARIREDEYVNAAEISELAALFARA